MKNGPKSFWMEINRDKTIRWKINCYKNVMNKQLNSHTRLVFSSGKVKCQALFGIYLNLNESIAEYKTARVL